MPSQSPSWSKQVMSLTERPDRHVYLLNFGESL